MKRAWDVINDVCGDKNEVYYKWQNASQGTYIGIVRDVDNFGFGKDYVFYDNGKLKWCENLGIDKAEVSAINGHDIQIMDKNENCLIVGVKNEEAKFYLAD